MMLTYDNGRKESCLRMNPTVEFSNWLDMGFESEAES